VYDRRVGESDFQIGLHNFSLLLVQVAAILTTLILIGTVALCDRCQPAPQDLRCVGPSPLSTALGSLSRT